MLQGLFLEGFLAHLLIPLKGILRQHHPLPRISRCDQNNTPLPILPRLRHKQDEDSSSRCYGTRFNLEHFSDIP